MSAFLGAIHISMYNRILYQDEMSEILLLLAEEKGWASNLRKLADSNAPAAVKEPLEEIIDQSNIHGWLSSAVAGTERRLALIAKTILEEHPERLAELQNVMKSLGQQHSTMSNAEQAFQIIHGILLDGMPCDFPFNIMESSESLVLWEVTTCPHATYWEGDVETYYLLRDAWIKGALDGSGIVHSRSSSEHSFRKE